MEKGLCVMRPMESAFTASRLNEELKSQGGSTKVKLMHVCSHGHALHAAHSVGMHMQIA